MTVLATAPTAYKQVIKGGHLAQLAGLRAAVSAGEHIAQDVWEAIRAELGLAVVDGIGADRDAAHLHLRGRRRHPSGQHRASRSPATAPRSSTRTTGPVGPGTEGRLAVIGPVGCRYLDDDRQLGYVVDGWNVTGDTFVQDEDGYFFYRARTDSMIVSSGYNIGAPEVEAAIDGHPDVVEAGVVGEPDPERGSVVSAFVVLREGVVGDEAKAREIQDHVKATLAPVQVPAPGPVRRPAAPQHERQAPALQAPCPGPGGVVMRIAVVGGGPGGLYLAALMKQLDADHEVTVWERNAPDDTFGFGVVFSDETLGGIESADTTVYAAMEHRFARWTDIDVLGRRALVDDRRPGVRGDEPQGAAAHPPGPGRRAGRGGPLPDRGPRPRPAAGGARPRRRRGRRQLAGRAAGAPTPSGPSLDQRHNKYIWFGTDLVFEAFQFIVRNTPWGTMQIHGYPYSDQGSTFIVEMHEDVWRRAGFDRTEDEVFPPGVSDDFAVERVAEIFADDLGGHRILTNNSKWLSFTTVRNESWHDGNVVLLGDAAHTAHFSIGSGTKLAMEDALALAACLHEHPTGAGSARGIPGGAQAGRGVDPARGAGQPRVVREHRHVRRPGPRRVRLQPADPLAPDHLREPQGARRASSPRRISGRVRPPGRRGRAARRRRGRPGDVPADPDRRPRAGQPGRAVPDGHVLRRRRRARRVPPRAPGVQGARRRGPGHVGDDLRLARGPDHARLPRPVDRRAARRLGPRDVVRPRPAAPHGSGCSSGTPAARARPSSCGRAWTSRCRRGQLGGRRPVGAAVRRGLATCRAR